MKMKITEHHGFDLIDFKIILIISKINRLVYLITIDRLLIILDWCHSDWEYKNMQIRAQNDPLTYLSRSLFPYFTKNGKKNQENCRHNDLQICISDLITTVEVTTPYRCTHDVHLLLNTK